MLTLNDIELARTRIVNTLRKTPLAPATFPPFSNQNVLLKLENMQRTGSFKERGALNKLLLLKERDSLKSIIAASAGNHAQAVSYHGSLLNFQVTLVMPKHTPINKVTASERWGAHVKLEGENFDEATSIALAMAKENNLSFVHAFDDLEIIAGQGTLGLEIFEQFPEVELVLIPVGGGGLSGGSAFAIKQRKPNCKVIGVQTESYPHVANIFRGTPDQKKPVEIHPTIGDGIAVKGLGKETLPLLKKYLDDIVLVSEEEMAWAILHLLESSKILVEGAGAAGFAALMVGKCKSVPSKTVVVISGGNIDVTMISRIIEKGLVKSRRMVHLNVVIPDRPGGLKALASLIADTKANIFQIHHERDSNHLSLYSTGTDLMLETRGPQHAEEVIHLLKQNGYSVEVKN